MPTPLTRETLMTVYQIFLTDSAAARSIPASFVWTDKFPVLNFPPKCSEGQRQDQGVHAAAHGRARTHNVPF